MHAEKLIWHQKTDKCDRSTEMLLWRRDVEISQRAGEMNFRLYNREYDPLV